MAKFALAVLLVAGCTATSDPATPSAAAPGERRETALNRHAPHGKHLSRRPPLSRASRSLRRSPVVYDWTAVAQCESGGNPRTDTGNGYYGEYQMTQQFWRSFGGLRYAPRPDFASELAQTIVAARGFAAQGMGAFPVCGRLLRTAS